MATHQRRRSSVDRASVESILKTGDNGQPAAPPSPHIGTSPNRTYFAMSPPPRPTIKHSRALSYNPRRPNRLSLSFPVAPSTSSSESARPTPTSSNAPSFPATPAAPMPTPSPSDPSGFLVALAGQERRVLELKEELHKAELDLRTLKRQWAYHEATKKKAEIRHVEPLQPLQTGVADGEDAIKRQSAELDRRKALLTNLNIPKETRRKFSGAHTRTLSLLSPERSNFPTQPFPPVPERFEGGLSRSTTMPDTSQGLSKINSHRARHSYQGGVTHGAKQLAEDVKSGLWTFLEDLRQATVGDEAVNGTINRPIIRETPTRKGSKASLKDKSKGRSPRGTSPRTWDSLTGNNTILDATNSASSDIDPPASTPKVTKKARPISLAAPALDDLDDDWGNWDSPIPKSPRWSGSTTASGPATPSSTSVDDANIKISTGSTPSSKREDIQWPALDKLSPGMLKGNLQRTMSAVMKEWEKTITPMDGEESGDPLGSAADEEGERRRNKSIHEDVGMLSR